MYEPRWRVFRVGAIRGTKAILRPRTGNKALQDEGTPVVHPGTRRAGKDNCSRVLALMVVCCALNLGSISAAAQGATPSSELLDQGRKLLEAGKLAEAELVLDRAEKLAPSDSVILNLDAKVKGRLGEYASAVGLLERVIRLIPQSAEAHVDLAIALADSGDLNSALAETATAISIDPALAIAHLNRARILSDMNRDGEARVEYALAARLAPGNPDFYFYWLFCGGGEGNFPQKNEIVRKVVKL